MILFKEGKKGVYRVSTYGEGLNMDETWQIGAAPVTTAAAAARDKDMLCAANVCCLLVSIDGIISLAAEVT